RSLHELLARTAATIPKVALEFGIIVDTPATLRDYAEITTPTLLIKGGKTRAPARAVVYLLSETLLNATVETLKGAGHMSPFTHPAELNQLYSPISRLGADRLAVAVAKLLDVASEQLLELLRLGHGVGANFLEIRVVLVVLIETPLVEPFECLDQALHLRLVKAEAPAIHLWSIRA